MKWHGEALPGRRPAPATRLAAVSAYAPPRPPWPIDLRLDGNEGDEPADQVLGALAGVDGQTLRRYPDAGSLERCWAAALGVEPERLLVTAGADEALDRTMRAFVDPGTEVILPAPTFEMLPRYAQLAGGVVVPVDWTEGTFPIDAVVAAIGPRTAAVAVVSPNNPTGAVATARDLTRLAAAAPHAILLVDLAYGEFASVDLFAAAAALPNAVVTRTLSKAWGLAGVRVGCVVGGFGTIDALRAAGGPYAVSAVSLRLAEVALRQGEGRLRAFVAAVRRRRDELAIRLTARGARPQPSEANFILARFADATGVHDALARRGIAVRRFPGEGRLADALRITVPARDEDLARLLRALDDAAAETPFEKLEGSDERPQK